MNKLFWSQAVLFHSLHGFYTRKKTTITYDDDDNGGGGGCGGGGGGGGGGGNVQGLQNFFR